MRRAGLAVAASMMALASLTACGGGSTEEFCDLDSELADVDMQDPDAAQDAMDKAVDAAPDEIKSDVETIADAVGEMDPEDSEAAMEAMSDPEFQEATDNVTKFTEENCSE